MRNNVVLMWHLGNKEISKKRMNIEISTEMRELRLYISKTASRQQQVDKYNKTKEQSSLR